MFKSWGFKLTNSSKGGKGNLGYKHTKESKIKISKKGIGRIISEETRKKISKGLKGLKKPKDFGIKSSLRQKGVPKKPESIEKMRITKTGKSLVQKVGLERANILKENLRKRMKNNTYAKGKSQILSEERKNQISNSLKKWDIIYMYDKELNLVKIFKDMKEVHELGFRSDSMVLVCKGIRKTHKNMIFSYTPLN